MTRRRESSAPSDLHLPGFGTDAAVPPSGRIVFHQRIEAPSSRRVEHRERFHPKLSEYELAAPHRSLVDIKRELIEENPRAAARIHRWREYNSHPDLWEMEGALIERLERAKRDRNSNLVRHTREALYRVGKRQHPHLSAADMTAHVPALLSYVDAWLRRESPALVANDREEREDRAAREVQRLDWHEKIRKISEAINGEFPFGRAIEKLVSQMEEIFLESRTAAEYRLRESHTVRSRQMGEVLAKARGQSGPPIPPALLEAVLAVDRLRPLRDRLYYLLLAG